jgi:hypothetical protein
MRRTSRRVTAVAGLAMLTGALVGVGVGTASTASADCMDGDAAHAAVHTDDDCTDPGQDNGGVTAVGDSEAGAIDAWNATYSGGMFIYEGVGPDLNGSGLWIAYGRHE